MLGVWGYLFQYNPWIPVVTLPQVPSMGAGGPGLTCPNPCSRMNNMNANDDEELPLDLRPESRRGTSPSPKKKTSHDLYLEAQRGTLRYSEDPLDLSGNPLDLRTNSQQHTYSSGIVKTETPGSNDWFQQHTCNSDSVKTENSGIPANNLCDWFQQHTCTSGSVKTGNSGIPASNLYDWFQQHTCNSGSVKTESKDWFQQYMLSSGTVKTDSPDSKDRLQQHTYCSGSVNTESKDWFCTQRKMQTSSNYEQLGAEKKSWTEQKGPGSNSEVCAWHWRDSSQQAGTSCSSPDTVILGPEAQEKVRAEQRGPLKTKPSPDQFKEMIKTARAEQRKLAEAALSPDLLKAQKAAVEERKRQAQAALGEALMHAEKTTRLTEDEKTTSPHQLQAGRDLEAAQQLVLIKDQLAGWTRHRPEGLKRTRKEEGAQVQTAFSEDRLQAEEREEEGVQHKKRPDELYLCELLAQKRTRLAHKNASLAHTQRNGKEETQKKARLAQKEVRLVQKEARLARAQSLARQAQKEVRLAQKEVRLVQKEARLARAQGLTRLAQKKLRLAQKEARQAQGNCVELAEKKDGLSGAWKITRLTQTIACHRSQKISGPACHRNQKIARPAQKKACHRSQKMARPTEKKACHGSQKITRMAEKKACQGSQKITRMAEKKACHGSQKITRLAQKKACHGSQKITRMAQKKACHGSQKITRMAEKKARLAQGID